MHIFKTKTKSKVKYNNIIGLLSNYILYNQNHNCFIPFIKGCVTFLFLRTCLHPPKINCFIFYSLFILCNIYIKR